MPCRVLYQCPCQSQSPHPKTLERLSDATRNLSVASVWPSASSSTHHQIHPPSQPPHQRPPYVPLPTYSPSAAYAYSPLSQLLYCEECDALRCNSCVTVEVAAWYCPNCLFEVPGASLRTERARCARNCFSCPVCQQTLQVCQTDTSYPVDPLSTAASTGEPPWYLACTLCKWDSKEVGLVFEKPTGLSLQLQKQEDSAPDTIEFDHLRDHFEPFLRAHVADDDPAALQAGGGTSLRDKKRGGQLSATQAAASAALRQSKLLRDVPLLATNPAYLDGSGGGGRSLGRTRRYQQAGSAALPRSALGAALEPRDELQDYVALSSWESGRAGEDMRGVLGRREENRRRWAEKEDSDARVSDLQQRWDSGWEQPNRVSDLKPRRVLLKSKLTKRCPCCRHIIIKSDSKASHTRYKIKLVALNYLPDIWVGLRQGVGSVALVGDESGGHAVGVGGGGGSSAGVGSSRRSSVMGLGGVAGSTLRARRPMSMLGGSSFGAGAGAGGVGPESSSISSSLGGVVTGVPLDAENLIPGRSYLYEVTFTNPLDDAIQVRLGVALPSHATVEVERVASPRLLEADESEGAGTREAATVAASSSSPPTSPPRPTAPPTPTQTTPRRTRKSIWSVVPTSVSFAVSAFNEVWELEEEEAELLGERGTTTSAAGKRASDTGIDEDDDVRGGGSDASGQAAGDVRATTTTAGSSARRSVSGVAGAAAARKGLPTPMAGGSILRRRGHTTTIGLELNLGPEAVGEIEFALLVTCTHRRDAETPPTGGGGGSGRGDEAGGAAAAAAEAADVRSFSFTTAVRLGRCLPLAATRPLGAPMTTSSPTKAGTSRAERTASGGGSAGGGAPAPQPPSAPARATAPATATATQDKAATAAVAAAADPATTTTAADA